MNKIYREIRNNWNCHWNNPAHFRLNWIFWLVVMRRHYTQQYQNNIVISSLFFLSVFLAVIIIFYIHFILNLSILSWFFTLGTMWNRDTTTIAQFPFGFSVFQILIRRMNVLRYVSAAGRPDEKLVRDINKLKKKKQL